MSILVLDWHPHARKTNSSPSGLIDVITRAPSIIATILACQVLAIKRLVHPWQPLEPSSNSPGPFASRAVWGTFGESSKLTNIAAGTSICRPLQGLILYLFGQFYGPSPMPQHIRSCAGFHIWPTVLCPSVLSTHLTGRLIYPCDSMTLPLTSACSHSCNAHALVNI